MPIIPELENIIVSYCDLETYVKLIELKPQKYNIIKYTQLQDYYEEYYSMQILEMYNISLENFRLLNNKDLKKLYEIRIETIIKIFDALQCCNIFKVNKPIPAKYPEYTGILYRPFINISQKVIHININIEIFLGLNNLLICKPNKFIKPKYLTPLWNLLTFVNTDIFKIAVGLK